MKQTVKRMAAVVLAAVMMLTLLTGCGAKGAVKETISNFETACHALDVRGMLECMNPTISKPLLTALNLLGVEDTSGVLEELVGILGIFEGAGEKTEEFVQSIKIAPQKYEFNDDKDKCTVLAELSYGEEKAKTITIDLVLKDETWYISDLDF